MSHEEKDIGGWGLFDITHGRQPRPSATADLKGGESCDQVSWNQRVVFSSGKNGISLLLLEAMWHEAARFTTRRTPSLISNVYNSTESAYNLQSTALLLNKSDFLRKAGENFSMKIFLLNFLG